MSELEGGVDSAGGPTRPPAGAVIPRGRVLSVVALSVAAALAALVTLGLVWGSVPAELASQWELDGTVSSVAPAWTSWLVPLLGAAIGVALPLIASHVLDALGRIPLAALGTGLGVLLSCMTAQVVAAQAGADPAQLPPMPNVFASLALGCAAAVLAAALFARSCEPR
jgi:hypothetical protein